MVLINTTHVNYFMGVLGGYNQKRLGLVVCLNLMIATNSSNKTRTDPNVESQNGVIIRIPRKLLKFK